MARFRAQLVKHPRTTSPETLKFIDLVNPLKTEYEKLIKIQLNKPGGGSLKDFPNWEEFLRKKLNKTVAEVKKIVAITDYHNVRPTVKIVDAKKELLDKLIELDNKKPGSPAPNYVLAEQAGYKTKFKDGKPSGNTSPPGSFKKLFSIEKKVLNRVDDVIANFGNMPVDKIKREGGIYRYIGKPFGFKTLEAVQVYMRKFPKKYKTARIDLALLQNPNTLNKYANRGLNADQLLAVYETVKSGSEFGRVLQKGPVAKIMEYAGRHVREGGQLVTKLDDNSFVYNNKIFSTEPKALSLKKALSKRGLQDAKIIDLIAEAHTQPEFKEIYKVFDELKEIEKIERPHPLTGKMTKLSVLIKEADNIAYPGRKDAWTKSGLALDHAHPDGIKGQPFKGIRVATRAMNEAAGQFMEPGKAVLQPEFGKKAMGYSFKGNILPPLNRYIDNTITKGVARPGKMEAAKLKAAGLSGQTLTSEIDPKFFQKTEGKGWDKFKGKYTRIPVLESTEQGLTIGSRLPTGKETRFGVAEADSMYVYLRDLLTKTKKGTPAYNKVCGIGSKIMGRFPQAAGGRTGYKAAGVVGSCPIIPALEAAPEQTMTELSKLGNQTGVLGKIRNTAKGFLGALGKWGPKVGKYGAIAAAGAVAQPLIKQFMNDDPSTYLTDPDQQAGMLEALIEGERPKPRSEILDWSHTAGTVGATAAAVPGTSALWKARRLPTLKREGMGMPRAALGPAMKLVSGMFTPAGLLATEPLRIAQKRREGESWGEIGTDPTMWMGPAFAPSMTRMATRGMNPASLLPKLLRLGMSRAALAAMGPVGWVGLAASLGWEGMSQYKDYKKGRGFFASDED